MPVRVDRRAIVPAIAALLVFAIVFGVDVSMAASTPGVGDEGEAQTVPYILGVAHPTGFPFYTLVGWVWSHALTAGTIAWRFNVLMSFATALSAAAIVLIAAEIGAHIAAAVTAALVFAFGEWVWNGAIHANVQPLATMLSLYALYAYVIFARNGDKRFAIGGAWLNGCAIATHPVALFVLPALALAFAWQRQTFRIVPVAACALGIVAPLFSYAYMPLRALAAQNGADPTYGEPLNGVGSVGWNLHGLLSIRGLTDVLFARAVSAPDQLARTGDIQSLPAAIALWFSLIAHNFFPGTLIIAALGIIVLARQQLRALTILAAGTAGGIAFTYVYRSDNHIDRYIVFSSAIVAVCAAALSCARLPRVHPRIVAAVVATALAALCAQSIILKARWVTLYAATNVGPALIIAVQRATPPNAIIVAQWDDATILAYGAYAEQLLDDRLIVAGWPLQYRGYYRQWAFQRPTYIVVHVDQAGAIAEIPPSVDVRERDLWLAGFRLYEIESPRNILRR